ncbi:MAG: hypothetical protein J7K89_03255 [Candidatus Cloacimonetes bacterium]|nr:hypothetical protein [Candidatus Cloacimonadota bacterium]
MTLCEVCGNEVAASASLCPFCGNPLSKKSTTVSRKFATFFIKKEMPTCDAACHLLEEQIRLCGKRGIKVLKVIHGYGSSGVGGELRWCLREYMDVLIRRGWMQYYVAGEELNRQTPAGRTLIGSFPRYTKDKDWGRKNKGITVIVV